MNAIFAIARKDLSQILRDKTGFFFIFIFPLLIGILFGYIFSGGGGGEKGPSGIKVLLVDQDHSTASEKFGAALSAESALEITPATDEAAATDQVRLGKSSAAVVLPKGFQESLYRVFEGNGTPIQVIIDPARQFERGIIEGMVTAAGFRTLATVFSAPDMSIAMLDRARASVAEATDLPPMRKGLLESLFASVENLSRDQANTAATLAPGEKDSTTAFGEGFAPVRVEVRSVTEGDDGSKTQSPFAITFPQASVWGIMGVVMGFGMSIVTERSTGTLTRLLMAPITRWHVIGGKALGCFIGAFLVQVVLFAIAITVFKVRPHSCSLLLLAIVSGCVCFVGVMMALAVIGKTPAASEGISRATLIVLALIGGGSVPLFVMPKFMQTIASVSPFSWLVRALEGALFREYTLAQMVQPCSVLIGIGIVGFVIGAILFREEN